MEVNNFFDLISDDMIYEIFLQIDILSGFRLLSVCKRFYKQSNNENIWEQLVLKWWIQFDFPNLYKISCFRLKQIMQVAKQFEWTWKLIARCIFNSKNNQKYKIEYGKDKQWVRMKEFKKMDEIEFKNREDIQKNGQRVFRINKWGYFKIGKFNNSMENGYVLEQYAYNDHYIGDIKNHQRHGKGIYYFYISKNFTDQKIDIINLCNFYCHKDLPRHEGGYINNIRHGNGKLTNGNGVVIESNFKDDVREGNVKIWLPKTNIHLELELKNGIPKDSNHYFHPKIGSILDEGKCSFLITGQQHEYWFLIYCCDLPHQRTWRCSNCHPKFCRIQTCKLVWTCGNLFCNFVQDK